MDVYKYIHYPCTLFTIHIARGLMSIKKTDSQYKIINKLIVKIEEGM